MPTIDEVQDITPRIEYIGTNGQTIYVYPFPIFDEKDIVVEIDKVDLTLNVDYTVTGVTDNNGGTIVLTVATTSGEAIVLFRETPIDRLTDYVENGDFLAATVNNDFDRIILMLQELSENSLNIHDDEPQEISFPLIFLEQVTFKNFAPLSETVPTQPNHLIRLQDLSQGEILLLSKEAVVIVEGQLEYTLNNVMTSQNAVYVDGKMQHITKGAYSITAEGNLLLSDSLETTQDLEVWNRIVVADDDDEVSIPLGNRGNPYPYESLHVLLNSDLNQALFKDGDWIECESRMYEGGGNGSLFKVEELGSHTIDYESVIPLKTGLVGLLVKGNRPVLGNNFIEVAAHRGFTLFNVEGTMLAFTSCLDYGANAIEFDVQFSSDGVMVLYHDQDTMEDDMNNITGKVKDNTYAQIQAATFKQLDGNFLQDKIQIPTLDELLDYIALVGCRGHLEIKAYRTEADINTIVNKIVAMGLEDNITMHSFIYNDIVQVRASNKRIKISYLATVTSGTDNGGSDIATSLELMKRDKNGAIALSLSAVDNPPVFPDAYVKGFQDAGVEVIAWTTESATDFLFARRNNVNTIISDYPYHNKTQIGLNHG